MTSTALADTRSDARERARFQTGIFWVDFLVGKSRNVTGKQGLPGEETSWPRYSGGINFLNLDRFR
jgi:hypothetical protein